MKKEFIPYNEALELKELGYNDYEKLALYCKGVLYQLYPNMHEDIPDNVYREVDAPLYQQAFRWFREKWGYTSWIEQVGNELNYKVYGNGVYHKPIYTSSYSSYCKSYEEAELKLLKELIIIVKEIE